MVLEAPSTEGSVSSESDILSQMASTRRSKACLTLMFSLALASKKSNPREKRDISADVSQPFCWNYFVPAPSQDSGSIQPELRHEAGRPHFMHRGFCLKETVQGKGLPAHLLKPDSSWLYQ